MKTNSFKAVLLVGWFSLVTGGVAFGQADALVDMLQKKGLLSQREANDVKEEMFSQIRDQMPGTKLTIGSWLDELKIGGDVRVRYETFQGRQTTSALGTFDDTARTRFRFRARLALGIKIAEWEAGLRLASGDTGGPASDAVSTNTTFDQFFGKKPINIDQAFITWYSNMINGLSITAGKMESPFWESDMVFDGDLTPEGISETYTHSFNSDYSAWVTAAQYVLAEDNTTQNNGGDSRGDDSYLLAAQIGHNWLISPKKFEVKQAVGFYGYEGIKDQVASAANTTTGAAIRNTLSTGTGGAAVWKFDYNVLTINNEIKLGYVEKIPVTLYGEWMKNLGVNEFDQGWKVGAKLWNGKKKGEYSIGYWYEELEADANVSMFSDSDFGGGGTNNKGHIIKANYMLTDWASLNASYWYVTSVDDFVASSSSGAQGAGTAANNQMAATHRLQVDVSLKF